MNVLLAGRLGLVRLAIRGFRKNEVTVPELVFKGKEFVYNHHLAVPYHPLVVHADRSIGAGTLDGNLIIHGDNLKALKSLLPHYAGKVDCVFIDPPYNTGSESWCYNDNVNSPMMREWFDGNPVTKEDLLRHDKWLCMMYPRLKLLHELLGETGTFWMTIDDNEMHRARMMLDEIFGESNFLACVCWHKKYAPSSDTVDFSASHDFILCYAKDRAVDEKGKTIALLNRRERTEEQNKLYKNPDDDPRGLWRTDNYLCNKTAEQRPNLYYPIIHPKTKKEIWPSKTSVWRYSKERHEKNTKEHRVWWGENKDNTVPSYKRFLSEVKGIVSGTWWDFDEVGHNDQAKKELKQIFPDVERPFDTPKPVALLERILELATDEESIILDSYAGSGTTAHAALLLNKKDGGNRNFILVEQENYADKTTAERVRRVINGYSFEGVQKEELFREKLSFANLKKPEKLLAQIAAIENLEEHQFDRISKTVDEGFLVVTGEKNITDKTEPLGGTFTFYTLGEPTDLNKILKGENLPEYETIGSWLFHTATGEAITAASIKKNDWYLGESSSFFVWLVYKPELSFLKSRDSALTLELAEKISKSKKGKKHLVFAPSKFVPNKLLLPLGVEHVTLPFGLFRIEKS